MVIPLASLVFFVIFTIVDGLDEAEIESRIQSLERQCYEEMRTLREENQLLKHELSRIKEHQTKVDADLEKWKEELLITMNSTKRSTEKGEKLLTFINNYQKRLLVGTQMTTQVPQAYVAFYARLTSKYDSLGERENVIYDTVVMNIGNGYDVNNGIFVCPISGIYFFAATIASDGGAPPQKNIDAEMVHQGNPIARLHATLYGMDMGSQVAVITCQQGEKVWIRHMEGAGDSKIIPANVTGFSGALLHQI